MTVQQGKTELRRLVGKGGGEKSDTTDTGVRFVPVGIRPIALHAVSEVARMRAHPHRHQAAVNHLRAFDSQPAVAGYADGARARREVKRFISAVYQAVPAAMPESVAGDIEGDTGAVPESAAGNIEGATAAVPESVAGDIEGDTGAVPEGLRTRKKRGEKNGR